MLLGGGCAETDGGFLWGALNRLALHQSLPLEGKVPNVVRRMRWRRRTPILDLPPHQLTALLCQYFPGKPFRGAHIQEPVLKQLIHTCAGTCAKLGDFPSGRPLSFSVFMRFSRWFVEKLLFHGAHNSDVNLVQLLGISDPAPTQRAQQPSNSKPPGPTRPGQPGETPTPPRAGGPRGGEIRENHHPSTPRDQKGQEQRAEAGETRGKGSPS